MVNSILIKLADFLWGWPLIFLVIAVSCAIMICTWFIQFRTFGYAWRLTLSPEMQRQKGDMSPIQAFVNALSVSLGNGSLAGVATAIAAGGPGAAVWIFVFGLLGMGLRFAEVYLGIYFPQQQLAHMTVGGPMVYLQQVPRMGWALSKIYAIFLVFLGFAGSASMQSNSMCIGCTYLFGISPVVFALFLVSFLAYVFLGGAQRMVHFVEAIVPLKVFLFFGSASIVLCYHYAQIVPALFLIGKCAFNTQAVIGACAGVTIQQALRFGFARAINVSEAGLGSAAVLFGGTKGSNPYNTGIMSMLSVFISTNIVCCLMALMIVVSGVFNQNVSGLALTIKTYETVFGAYGAFLVTLLSLTFGLGVMISYSYIAASSWLYVTQGRFEWLFKALFCLCAAGGALGTIDVVWNLCDVVNACLLIINMIGIVWLLPLIYKQSRHVMAYEKKTYKSSR